jgi:hypothetical protein
MKPEQKIYQRLRRDLEQRYGIGRVFIQRIETSTGSGIPDVHVVCPDFVGWIETKTIDYNVSKEQYAWMKLYEDRGGRSVIVTLVDDKLLWLAVDVRMLNYRTLGRYIIEVQPQPISFERKD